MTRITTASILSLLLLASFSLATSSNYERSVEDIIVTRQDLHDLFGRDVVDYLEERDSLNPADIDYAVHTAKRVGSGLGRAYEIHGQIQSAMNNRRELTDDDELRAREDLVEREPFGLGKAFKFVKGLFGREFDEEYDLLERDYYDDLD